MIAFLPRAASCLSIAGMSSKSFGGTGTSCLL
jgi:hypothetical protein